MAHMHPSNTNTHTRAHARTLTHTAHAVPTCESGALPALRVACVLLLLLLLLARPGHCVEEGRLETETGLDVGGVELLPAHNDHLLAPARHKQLAAVRNAQVALLHAHACMHTRARSQEKSEARQREREEERAR